MEKGDRVGSWEVVVGEENTPDHIHGIICKCDCGNRRVVAEWELNLTISGDRNGCEYCDPSDVYERYPSFHPLFKTWNGMKKRCSDKKNNSYSNYGGRGITVCSEWSDSFITFLRDMKYRPKKMSLDRIDNNKGYSLDNCRWATNEEQAQNTRRTTASPELVREVRHKYDNKNMKITNIAKEVGLGVSTVHDIVKRKTWKNIK